MSKVAVIDTNKNVLEPCHPAVARRLLKRGQAAVWKRYPFTIILKHAVDERVTGNYTLSWDPGSKTSGIAITSESGDIVYAAELHHRGNAIKKALGTRSGFRRGRRTRNLRYRPARWANRGRKVPVLTEKGWTYQRAEESEASDTSKKQNTFNRVSWAQLRDARYQWERLPQTKTNRNQKKRWKRVRVAHQKRADNGWVAPSLMSRVFNLETWTRRLCKVYPITHLAIETVKFDMQLMEKPEIHGIQYQQGTLHGREIREYLLELTRRKCAYCKADKVRLEVEHIVPKAKGGSSRPDNLTMACRPCNQKKGNLVDAELVAKLGSEFAKKVKAAKRTSKTGLSDAAAVNTIRWKLFETLKAIGMPVVSGTGGKTAHHRDLAGLPKTHYYDAAAVASIPKQPKSLRVDVIQAMGYGRRDNLRYAFGTTKGGKYPGFRQLNEKRTKSAGFRKFDHVELTKRDGTKWKGVINCFDKTDKGKPRRCRVKCFSPDGGDSRKPGNTSELRLLQHRDGYSYGTLAAKMAFREPISPPVSEVSEPRTDTGNAMIGSQLDFLSLLQ